MLLQVVSLTRDVGRDLDAGGQTHTRDLTERRVRLLRGGREHTRADTATLGRTLERGRLVLLDLVLPALPDQLLDRRHYFSGFCVPFVKLTWNIADPRGRVCRILQAPALGAEGAQIAVATDELAMRLRTRTGAQAHPRHKA
ncbi:protein of unknown function [Streptomyces sp. KY75]|nr:protein of unknown function [Streptomyces sp. KY70]CAD5981858.1 protein of unknown function [Streptomyces sp. KY75]